MHKISNVDLKHDLDHRLVSEHAHKYPNHWDNQVNYDQAMLNQAETRGQSPIVSPGKVAGKSSNLRMLDDSLQYVPRNNNASKDQMNDL